MLREMYDNAGNICGAIFLILAVLSLPLSVLHSVYVWAPADKIRRAEVAVHEAADKVTTAKEEAAKKAADPAGYISEEAHQNLQFAYMSECPEYGPSWILEEIVLSPEDATAWQAGDPDAYAVYLIMAQPLTKFLETCDMRRKLWNEFRIKQ